MSRASLPAVAVTGLLLCLLLAGCSGGGKKVEQQVVLPEEITQQDLERATTLVSKFPTAFSFPGQEALAPLVHWINGTLAPGTGSTGVELPNDDGPVDYGAEVVVFDVADKVPVGQPVEVRLNLKWWGDPGRAADLDIWVDMPGTQGAVEPLRYDESNNWNIITKQRVVNAVHLEGQPFAVGLQVNNGRIFDASGSVPYVLSVEFHYVANVLPPGAPYALQVPANSTFLVIDTERVVGDEHVDVDFVLVGPDDKVVRAMHHNDIGQETLSISVRGGGEYILYAHKMHGGFLRVESELPNERFEARLLATAVEERILYGNPAPLPGTYVEQSPASSNTFGATGELAVGPTFPLDIVPFIRSDAAVVDAALNITSGSGWYATAYARTSYNDERGRVGATPVVRIDRSGLDAGPYTYGVVSNGVAATLGVQIITYVR